MDRAQKIVILIVAIIEMGFFTGVFYGYNSLIPIFKKDRVFSQLCHQTWNYNETIPCTSQDTYFTRAFATWLIVQTFASFVLGMALDKFGIRFTKIVAAIFLLGGFLCFAFTHHYNWLLFLGGSLLTMSAHCLALANISVSVIFSGNSNMIISLYNALFDASAISMSGIKYFTDLGVPFWILCCSYGAVGFVFVLSALFLVKNRIEQMTPTNNEAQVGPKKLPEGNLNNLETSQTLPIIRIYSNYLEERFKNLKQCYISPEYIIQVAFVVILGFRFTFFLTQMSLQINYLFPTDKNLVNHLLSVSNIFFLGSLLIGPAFGFLLDKYQKHTCDQLSKNPHVTPQTIYNTINVCFWVPSCICSISLFIASLLVFVANKYVFYIVFICMAITRSLLFSINGAYIFSAFPKKYFGTLMGSLFFIVGLVNLSQNFIISFASSDGHPDIVNYILVGLCALTIGHGLFLKFKK